MAGTRAKNGLLVYHAGITSEKAMSFYVYRLIDPRDSSTFYIGKGTGKRAWLHELDARAGRIGNKPKHNRIMAIIISGLSVGVEIAATFLDERLAYAHEWDLIRSTSDLTNIIGGTAKELEPPPTPDEIRRARVEAKRQQVLKLRNYQHAKFVEGLPIRMQGIASEWVAGLKPETIRVRAKKLAQPATPWEVIGPEKKRKRKLRRKRRRPAQPFEIRQIRVPPKI